MTCYRTDEGKTYRLQGDLVTWKEEGGASTWEDIKNKPKFAAVATTGSYNDLTDRPLALTSVSESEGKIVVTNADGTTTELEVIATDNGVINKSLEFTVGKMNFTNNAQYKEFFFSAKAVDGSKGAMLVLRNIQAPAEKDRGSFSFATMNDDGTQTAVLNGYRDGTLNWNGKNIVRSINGVEADAGGNVVLSTVKLKVW